MDTMTAETTDIEAACAEFVPTWLARMREQAEAAIGLEAQALTDSDWQEFFALPQFSITQAGELLVEACRTMCAVAKPEVDRLRAENAALRNANAYIATVNPCDACQRGYRLRDMATFEGRRLCVHCLKAEAERLMTPERRAATEDGNEADAHLAQENPL